MTILSVRTLDFALESGLIYKKYLTFYPSLCYNELGINCNFILDFYTFYN